MCVICACVWNNNKNNHCYNKFFSLNSRPPRSHLFLSQRPHTHFAASVTVFLPLVQMLAKFSNEALAMGLHCYVIDCRASPHIIFQLTLSVQTLQTWNQKESHDPYQVVLLFLKVFRNLNPESQVLRFLGSKL